MVLKDFSNHADPDKAAMQWWKTEFCKPFELYDTQLFKYFLLKTSEASFYYAVCAHHLIMDGYSFAILHQQMLENYNALIKGSGKTGSKPSYVDFISNDLTYRSSDAFSQAKAYWSNKFKAIPRPVIPRRYAAGSGKTVTPSAFSHIWFSPDFYDQLITYSKQRQGNVFFSHGRGFVYLFSADYGYQAVRFFPYHCSTGRRLSSWIPWDRLSM